MYQMQTPQQPLPAMHAQENPWAGEISGMAPVLSYEDPAAQQSAAYSAAGSAPHLNMSHGLPEGMIATPQSVDEAYMGSLKAMLAQNVGNHIVASFLMGSQNLMSWEGILFDVGNNYLTIYQPPRGRYIVGDLYSLKFMEFYEPSQRNGSNQLSPTGNWQQAL